MAPVLRRARANRIGLSQVGKRENTAVVVSPVVSPEVANDLSISDVLNDGFVGSQKLSDLAGLYSFPGRVSEPFCFTDRTRRHRH